VIPVLLSALPRPGLADPAGSPCELPPPALVSVGVGSGLDGGGLVGSEVGVGDCDPDGVGDGDVADGDGELDVVGVVDCDGVALAFGDAVEDGHADGDVPG